MGARVTTAHHLVVRRAAVALVQQHFVTAGRIVMAIVAERTADMTIRVAGGCGEG